MTKQQTVELLQQQLPGFYSVEQVIKMINDIEDSNESFEFSDAHINDLSSDIADALSQEGTSIVDDYELSISGREVELDSIDFDSRTISNIVSDIVTDFMEQFKEEASA